METRYPAAKPRMAGPIRGTWQLVAIPRRTVMGAAIVIPLIVIVLAAVGYLLWTLFAAGRGAVTVAKSVSEGGTGETAVHSDERTKSRHSDTTPVDPDNH